MITLVIQVKTLFMETDDLIPVGNFKLMKRLKDVKAPKTDTVNFNAGKEILN